MTATRPSRSTTTTASDERLARTKPDPHRPGPDRWRLVPSERPIWAIIMHIYTIDDIDDAFHVSDETIAETAAAYDISDEEVRAALAYYAANPGAIDTILAANTDLDLKPRRG